MNKRRLKSGDERAKERANGSFEAHPHARSATSSLSQLAGSHNPGDERTMAAEKKREGLRFSFEKKKQSKAKREKERSDAVVLRGKKKDDDGERERERRELPRAGGQKPSKKRN